MSLSRLEAVGPEEDEVQQDRLADGQAFALDHVTPFFLQIGRNEWQACFKGTSPP
jgi:hypothetical protein